MSSACAGPNFISQKAPRGGGPSMSRRSRKAKRRQKWRRRVRRAQSPLDQMHRALGEFLTECGPLEFLMILFADYISEPGIEAIFADLSGPFGPKLKAFKAWCDHSGVSKEDRPILDHVYKKLDELLPKRNFLIHGETHEAIVKGRPKQAYRVGITKKDPDYLDEFDRGQLRENVFDVQQVRAASKLCRDIASDLHMLRYGRPL
jgi:hypothetical protein